MILNVSLHKEITMSITALFYNCFSVDAFNLSIFCYCLNAIMEEIKSFDVICKCFYVSLFNCKIPMQGFFYFYFLIYTIFPENCTFSLNSQLTK